MEKSTFIALSCALVFTQEASTPTGIKAFIYSCPYITGLPHALNINKALKGGTRQSPTKEAAQNIIDLIGLNEIQGPLNQSTRTAIQNKIIHEQSKHLKR